MKTVQLTKGYVSLVDDEDYDRVTEAGPWHARVDIHTVYAENGSSQAMHRFILGITDPKVEVDHRWGNGLDNQRANLRTATRTQNAQNRLKNKGHLYKGVTWNVKDQKWRAQIRALGKKIYLGSFNTALEAAAAYDAAALKYHGEFALTNAASA